jgi:HEAT repeat protein
MLRAAVFGAILALPLAAQTGEVARLIEELEEEGPPGRAKAAQRLGDLRARAAIPALVDVVGDASVVDENAIPLAGGLRKPRYVGEVAAVALARIGAEKELIEQMRAENLEAAEQAAFGLAHAATPASWQRLAVLTKEPALLSPLACLLSDETISSAALRPAVPTLLAALKHSSAGTRGCAARALAFAADPRAAEGLAAALTDPDPEVRIRAATALGGLRDVRALPLLPAALADEDLGHRAAAALASLGPAGTEALLSAITHMDSRVRQHAAFGLGEIGRNDPRAIPPLTRALEDKDFDVIAQAHYALLDIGRPAAPAVLALLDKPDPDVRGRAVRLLGEMRERSAVPRLIDLLAGPDSGLRKSAMLALLDISGQPLGYQPERWRKWWASAQAPAKPAPAGPAPPKAAPVKKGAAR